MKPEKFPMPGLKSEPSSHCHFTAYEYKQGAPPVDIFFRFYKYELKPELAAYQKILVQAGIFS